MGAIQDELNLEPDRSKWNRIKAQRLAELGGETFTRGQFSLTIDSIRVDNLGVLDIHLTLRRNNRIIPIDGHLRYPNPRILVPDGTFRDMIDPATGNIVQIPNFIENARAALREMILGTLREQVAAL